MKLKHTYTWLLSLLLTIFVLSGCSSQPTSSTIRPTINEPGEPLAMPAGEMAPGDDQYTFERPIALMVSMAQTEDGLYFFSGMSEYFLYYMDKDTGKVSILCNKPDCLHDEEPDIERIADCNALFIPGENKNLLFADPYLYVIAPQIDPKTSAEVYKLIQVSQDGAQRKEIYTFPDKPVSFTIHRGYAYWSTDDGGTEPGREAETTTTARIYRLALENMGQQPEMLFETQGTCAYISKLTGYRNMVYFNYSTYEDATMAVGHPSVMRINLNNLAVEQVADSAGSYGFCGDKLVFYYNGQLYMGETNGEGIKPLETAVQDFFFSDDQYIVVDTLMQSLQNEGKPRMLYVYDLQGQELMHFDISMIDSDTRYGSDAENIYIGSKSGENEFGPCYSLWTISKDKIKDGTATVEEAFRYEPKIPDRGVVTSFGG